MDLSPNLPNLAQAIRAANHTLRKQIINLIEENDAMTVQDIFIKLRLEQSVASQHLAILRQAKLVETDRKGKFIYYSLEKNNIEWLNSLADDWNDEGKKTIKLTNAERRVLSSIMPQALAM